MQEFRKRLFMCVVANLKNVGLLGPPVRKALTGLRINQFEEAHRDPLDQRIGLPWNDDPGVNRPSGWVLATDELISRVAQRPSSLSPSIRA